MAYEMFCEMFCDHCDASLDERPNISIATFGVPIPDPGIHAQFCSLRCLRAWAIERTDADELPGIHPPKGAG